MATKPTEEAEWAVNEEVDGETGAPNKLEPTGEFKLSGLKVGQPLPRAFLNYQFDKIDDWLKYLSEEVDTLIADGATTTLQAVYPVGSYYMSNESTDPNTLFGFGTWTRVKGKFIIGLDEADTDFDGAGEEGGSKTHTHTDNYTIDGHVLSVGELPAAVPFSLDSTTSGSSSTSAGSVNPLAGDVSVGTTPSTSNINWNGNGDEHTHGMSGGVQSSSNLPPYKAAYIFFRTS